jgi:hypothetical protein
MNKGKMMKRPIKKKPKVLPKQVEKEEMMPAPGLAEGAMPFKKLNTSGVGSTGGGY